MAVFFRNQASGESVFHNNADAVRDMRIGGPANPSVAKPRFMVPRKAKIPLSNAANTAGAIFAWQNDEGGAVIIDKVTIYTSTKATAACTIDVGTTTASATTLSDNLIDGLDIFTAAGVFDSITEKGTNGRSRQLLPSLGWVTASTASGAVAGTVGFAYLEYHRI